MAFNKEVYISESPSPFSIKETETIIQQMKKSICKIHNGDKKGTGFFCKISSEKYKIVLITCYHVFNQSDFKNNHKLNFSTFQNNYSISLKEKRNYYFSNEKEYDISIIELYPNEIKDIEYLELDDNIFKKDFYKNNLIGKTLYNIQYQKVREEVLVSYGIVKNQKIEKEYKFAHSCCTEEGSSGSPILMQNSNKIIGIHYGTDKEQETEKKYNLANFLNEPIKKFIDKLNLEKEKKNSSLSNIKDPLWLKKNLNKVKINQRYTNEKDKKNRKKEELKSNNKTPREKTIDKEIEKKYLDKLMRNNYISKNIHKKLITKNVKIITSSKGNNNNILLPLIPQNSLKKNTSMSSLFEKKEMFQNNIKKNI